jgi:pyruvate-formate lyase-activating enzyme
MPGRAALARLPGCNFRCRFCDARTNPFLAKEAIPERSECQIRDELNAVLASDKAVKITGGEPTIQPKPLLFLAETVKHGAGAVLLDSNGSRPDLIIQMARQGLLDQLGVGLKGTSSDAALAAAQISSRRLAWDNPVRSIGETAVLFPNIKVVTTFVVTGLTGDNDIRQAFALFKPSSGNHYLKFNNIRPPFLRDEQIEQLMKREGRFREDISFGEQRDAYNKAFLAQFYQGVDMAPLPPQTFIARLRNILLEFPGWMGKTIIQDINGATSSDGFVKI